MVPSDEVNSATGEAPTAADLLEQKQRELRAAERDLAAAELAMDVQEVVRLQHTIAVVKQFIDKLSATVAVEAAAESQVEAAALDAELRARYADALAALSPDIEEARLAIQVMAKAVRKCAKTWSAAQRAGFERALLKMRFALDGKPLDALPASPLDAVTAAFWEEIDKMDRLCRKDALPPVLVIASDTDAQRQVKEMLAAAEFVQTYGKDLRLSEDLASVFAKAGPVQMLAAPPAPQDAAFIGTLPAGAVQSALGPTHVWEPDTAKEKAEREHIRRNNAKKQAAVAREVADAAKAEIAERDPLQGPLKGNPLKGR